MDGCIVSPCHLVTVSHPSSRAEVAMNMESNPSKPATTPRAVPEVSLLDRVLMAVFWMLLGGAAGIKVLQSVWHFLGFDVGEVTIAVPVGGVLGALVGLLLGMIKNP